MESLHVRMRGTKPLLVVSREAPMVVRRARGGTARPDQERCRGKATERCMFARHAHTHPNGCPHADASLVLALLCGRRGLSQPLKPIALCSLVVRVWCLQLLLLTLILSAQPAASRVGGGGGGAVAVLD